MWELVDTHYPDRAGSRFHTLATATRAADKAQPAGRFVLRWITPTTKKDGQKT